MSFDHVAYGRELQARENKGRNAAEAQRWAAWDRARLADDAYRRQKAQAERKETAEDEAVKEVSHIKAEALRKAADDFERRPSDKSLWYGGYIQALRDMADELVKGERHDL